MGRIPKGPGELMPDDVTKADLRREVVRAIETLLIESLAGRDVALNNSMGQSARLLLHEARGKQGKVVRSDGHFRQILAYLENDPPEGEFLETLMNVLQSYGQRFA